MKQAAESFRRIFVPFCEGRAYMLLIGALVLVGHLCQVEFWLNIVHLLLLCLSLCLSDSVKPLVVSNLTFVFQVTLRHSPSEPYNSTYYFEGVNLYIVLALVVLLLASLGYYLVRTRFFRHLSLRGTPMLLPLGLVSVAFLTNGVAFSMYVPANLVFGIVQVAVWLLDFLVLYDGLSREEPSELMPFVVDLSIMISWILIAELANAYALAEMPGWVQKSYILFGWGVSNSCACCLAVQVPILFYGAIGGRRTVLSAVTAVCTCLAIFFTLSRTALLFTVLIAFLCFVCLCIFSKRRLIFCLVLGALSIVAVALMTVFKHEMLLVIDHFVVKGFSDSGRLSIWRAALGNFGKNPVFGVGFYGAALLDTFSTGVNYTTFYPVFSHNTLVEMLTSAGAFGLVAYLYMRACTIRILLRRLTREKLFLGLSILMFLLVSALDIFTFSVYPVFFYNLFLATACVLDRRATEEQTSSPS